MDALNHADQMRLANLINDNSDDAEIQKKLDQVVELTSSTRDQAAVALHDCHYDVGKAVDMILEGDHANEQSQWRSAGKKKNKNQTQANKGINNNNNQLNSKGSNANNNSNNSNKAQQQQHHQPHHHHHHQTSANTNSDRTIGGGSGSHRGAGGSGSNAADATNHSGGGGYAGGQRDSTHHQRDHHHNSSSTANQHNHHHHHTNQHHTQHQHQTHTSRASSSQITNSANETNPINEHHAPSLNKANLNSANATATANVVGVAAANITGNSTNSSLAANQQLHLQQSSSQHKKSTRIPDSAVEMPNNELHIPSLNVQFGEMDLRDGSNVGSSGTGALGANAPGAANDAKGTFQDVLESNRLSRHSTIPSQDNKTNRHSAQQPLANKQQGRPRRPYNNNSSNNTSNDDRRFNNSYSNRGGRQISGSQRPYNSRPGQMNNNNSNTNNTSNNNSRGIRTILNRGLQPNSNLPANSSNQSSGGFPNSIDTWTNSTAEQASKPTNADQAIGVGGTLRVGQWSDVAGNEDWSEEDWDAKVMETKVFTPSTKQVDVSAPGQKSQPLLTDKSVPSQMNPASKLSELVRDDVSSQQNTLNTVTQQGHSQHSSQKPISHINDIFDASMAKVVLEQQNLAAMKPKTTIGMSQYNKESSDTKTVLDPQNLNSIKPKTTMSMNQYSKEASESLKSLVGISSTKGGVPSVPPGALPLMSQPQYIMGNAYHQPAMIPYYQAPDVHYQVAAPTTGRDQNFQSVYSQNDALKFNRGTDGDAPSITTTQAAPVASQTHNQAFVANALHAGYQLTYAMPGTFNMIPQNLYGAAPIFPHIPQPTNTGSANTVYQKNTAASYQHHTGYSAYDQLNPLIGDYVKQQQNYSSSNIQQQQTQQPTSKASGVSNELDVSAGNSYGMYGSVNKGQPQPSKQANYTDSKSYQQMSNNGPQQQFGFSHNTQQPSSIAGYPLLQAHNLDNSTLNSQSSAQQQLQHNNAQRGGSQVNSSKYYPSWN